MEKVLEPLTIDFDVTESGPSDKAIGWIKEREGRLTSKHFFVTVEGLGTERDLPDLIRPNIIKLSRHE